jgi:hypothetical protein
MKSWCQWLERMKSFTIWLSYIIPSRKLSLQTMRMWPPFLGSQTSLNNLATTFTACKNHRLSPQILHRTKRRKNRRRGKNERSTIENGSEIYNKISAFNIVITLINYYMQLNHSTFELQIFINSLEAGLSTKTLEHVNSRRLLYLLEAK